MKKIIISLAGLAVIIALAFSYAGCKKEEPDRNTKAAENNALAENMFADVFKQLREAASRDTNISILGNISTSGGPTLTVTPTVDSIWPKTLTIDFDTACLGFDGYWRSGKIIAVFSGLFETPLTTIDITFDSLYVNGNLIQGTEKITNKGRCGTTNANNFVYDVTITNGTVTSDSGVVSWSSGSTYEWTAGESTPATIYDDTYYIRGTASGTDVSGNSFTVTTINPMRIQTGCRWIESGVLEITPAGLVTRTVDFGNGACDKQVSINISGYTFGFSMP